MKPETGGEHFAVRFLMRLALFERQEAFEFLGIGPECVGQRRQRRLALGDRRCRPAGKRAARRRDGAIEIFGRRVGRAADDGLVRGIDDIEPGRSGGQLATDQHSVITGKIHLALLSIRDLRTNHGISTTLMHSPFACAATASLIALNG